MAANTARAHLQVKQVRARRCHFLGAPAPAGAACSRAGGKGDKSRASSIL
jgi:hypothetical protein